MGWVILGSCIAVLSAVFSGLLKRRAELRAMARTLAERKEARARGSHQAQLQYPHLDLSRCIGCGSCIRACPEEGVLALVHGQAAVVHGARCVGHGLCARECPVGGIQVILGDLGERRDIPALTPDLEVKGVEGLFLAGEVTGYALIRTAIRHGSAVAGEVAGRCRAREGVRQRRSEAAPALAGQGRGGRAPWGAAEGSAEPRDLCIVGAGPAGLACALRARKEGLDYVLIEREELGGTVAKYPRRKLVMTQPVDLPLYGRLSRETYRKEELMDLWVEIVDRQGISLRTGVEFRSLEKTPDGYFEVETSAGRIPAKQVALCLGRRGKPRKLGVPGEELPKVTYSLMDAQSYRGRRILVLGGGDSAVEAALGLAAQPGNRVTLSYRKKAFFRIKARNEERLLRALRGGELQVLFESEALEIRPESVRLRVGGGSPGERVLENDEVFVFAGGVPPFELLEKAGVSFDPKDRESPAELGEQGTGLLKAMTSGLLLALLTLLWCLIFSGYYDLPLEARPDLALHDHLKPKSPIGIVFGVGAALLILGNLVYLIRKSRIGRWISGTLQDWLSCHIVTGILAMLLALVHGGLEIRNAPGGHALIGLIVLVISGAIGRYFYSHAPKAANGRTLALEELEARMASISGEWDREGGEFGAKVRRAVEGLIKEGHWETSFLERIRHLFLGQLRLIRTLSSLRKLAYREGIPRRQFSRLQRLARRAHRTALMATHYEDLRGVLSSWRFLHRWVALVMVTLLALHIVTAFRFGNLF